MQPSKNVWRICASGMLVVRACKSGAHSCDDENPKKAWRLRCETLRSLPQAGCHGVSSAATHNFNMQWRAHGRYARDSCVYEVMFLGEWLNTSVTTTASSRVLPPRRIRGLTDCQSATRGMCLFLACQKTAYPL